MKTTRHAADSREEHCPATGCGKFISTWGPAWRNHELTHAEGGYPYTSKAISRPENCGVCGLVMVARSWIGELPAGAVRYAWADLCNSCRQAKVRARLQPPGTPRAQVIRRDELVEEVRMLWSSGVYEPAICARRIGMKPLSYQRAVHRAVAAGHLPPHHTVKWRKAA